MGRAANGKARNPKSEIRKKAEARNPNANTAFGLRIGSQKNFKTSAKPGKCRPTPSRFGLRISDFFRVSDFALRIFCPVVSLTPEQNPYYPTTNVEEPNSSYSASPALYQPFTRML